MATPILTRNTSPLPTIYVNTPQELDLGIVKDEAGDPIDISSGWSARLNFPYSTPAGGNEITKTGTFAYGADGSLKLTLTSAQANQILAGGYTAAVYLSDDSFATSATHQGGFMQVISP